MPIYLSPTECHLSRLVCEAILFLTEVKYPQKGNKVLERPQRTTLCIFSHHKCRNQPVYNFYIAACVRRYRQVNPSSKKSVVQREQNDFDEELILM